MILEETGSEKIKTYVGIVLDESGSMSSAYKEIISGLTEQIQSIQDTTKEDMETFIVFTSFNDTSRLRESVNVKNFDFSILESYNPRGMTAMLDAVGETIQYLKTLPGAEDETTSFLIVIATDGEENSSTTFGYSEVAEMIQSVKDTKRWTVTYMGANQDLSLITERLKIDAGNITMFDASSSAGYSKGMLRASSATTSYMSTRGARGPAGPSGQFGPVMTSVDSFYSDNEDKG